jgi:hypothetical protein
LESVLSLWPARPFTLLHSANSSELCSSAAQGECSTAGVSTDSVPLQFLLECVRKAGTTWVYPELSISIDIMYHYSIRHCCIEVLGSRRLELAF